VRKGWAKDCVGKDHVHMIEQIKKQFAELQKMHTENKQKINEKRPNEKYINEKFQAALIQAVEDAHSNKQLKTGGFMGYGNWYKMLESESGRGKEFMKGMWEEIAQEEKRVLLFGHSSMFRAILKYMPGKQDVPAYYKKDKIINYGHLKINFNKENEFKGVVAPGQCAQFKIGHYLMSKLLAKEPNDKWGNSPVEHDVQLIKAGSDPIDHKFKYLYKKKHLATKDQINEIYQELKHDVQNRWSVDPMIRMNQGQIKGNYSQNDFNFDQFMEDSQENIISTNEINFDYFKSKNDQENIISKNIEIDIDLDQYEDESDQENNKAYIESNRFGNDYSNLLITNQKNNPEMVQYLDDQLKYEDFNIIIEEKNDKENSKNNFFLKNNDNNQ